MSGLEIEQFICGADNYAVIIHEPESGATAAIDTPEAGPIRAVLSRKGWRLSHIFTTHHHGDHVAGHLALKSETGCRIFGAEADKARIPGIDETLKEGDSFPFGPFEVRVLETPGHTSGHICFWLPEAGRTFVGDTLFPFGCGRLLEGTASQMWHSLQKLAALPPETLIHCGHEYTLANGRFALTLEPGNQALRRRYAAMEALRAEGKHTVPSRLADEIATNPFLRASSPEIQAALGLTGRPLEEVFAEVRRRKDIF